MSATSVGVNNNRIGRVEQSIVGRPTIANHIALHVGDGPFHGIGQNATACIVFMRTEVMAWTSGDEHDPFGWFGAHANASHRE
jgi:hypothetical protein